MEYSYYGVWVAYIIVWIGTILYELGFQSLGEFLNLIGMTVMILCVLVMYSCELILIWLDWLERHTKSVQRPRTSIFQIFELFKLKIFKFIQSLLEKTQALASYV
jgi:hypothetical protein